ncbi:MAG: hypothetical protein HC876_21625 [Chloroflexaceae bacterium]|nr:hypothetical protein [Chloroflexaceae bacterium]
MSLSTLGLWKTSGDSQTDEVDLLIRSPTLEPQTTIVPQSGPPGTVYTITATRFEPDEPVVTWPNLPDGSTRDIGLSGQAGNPGNIQLQFDSSALQPGD